MKPMFTSPDEQYNDAGRNFDLEISEALKPVVKKYVELGFSIRHIQLILAHTAFEAGLTARC